MAGSACSALSRAGPVLVCALLPLAVAVADRKAGSTVSAV
jgi:hypothetical protein